MPKSEDRSNRKDWKRSWIELFAHAVTLSETTVDGVGEHMRIIHLLIERAEAEEAAKHEAGSSAIAPPRRP